MSNAWPALLKGRTHYLGSTVTFQDEDEGIAGHPIYWHSKRSRDSEMSVKLAGPFHVRNGHHNASRIPPSQQVASGSKSQTPWGRAFGTCIGQPLESLRARCSLFVETPWPWGLYRIGEDDTASQSSRAESLMVRPACCSANDVLKCRVLIRKTSL